MSFVVRFSPEGRAGPLLPVLLRPVPFLIFVPSHGTSPPASLKVPFVPSEMVKFVTGTLSFLSRDHCEDQIRPKLMTCNCYVRHC